MLNAELNKLIHKSNIPDQLKSYLNESNRIKKYLNESMLSEIEELFIFYKALYYFDETEFSTYTISSLKRGSDVDVYYYYLKKILDSNLELISKSPRIHQNNKKVYNFKVDRIELENMFRDIANEFGQNIEYLYSSHYEKIDILKTYYLLGKMELINSIINDSFYLKMNRVGKKIIEDKIKGLELSDMKNLNKD